MRSAAWWSSVEDFWGLLVILQTGFLDMVIGGRLSKCSGHLWLVFLIWSSVEDCWGLLVISDWRFLDMVLGGSLFRSSGHLRLVLLIWSSVEDCWGLLVISDWLSRYGVRWKSVQIFWSSQTGFINMVLGGRLLRSSGHLRLAFSIWSSVVAVLWSFSTLNSLRLACCFSSSWAWKKKKIQCGRFCKIGIGGCKQ